MTADPKRSQNLQPRSSLPSAPPARELGLIKSLSNLERQVTEALSPSIIRQLLMNACDALPNGDRRGQIRIAISRNALYVANRGRAFDPPGLAEGGLILGEAPRESGEGFARRGLGMRAALALSRRPEVYSGPQKGDRGRLFEQQWRFDALHTQREVAGEGISAWDHRPEEWRGDLSGPGDFPVLWRPYEWEIPTPEIRRELERAIAGDGGDAPLDTVIRLEHGALDFEPWLKRVRRLVAEEVRHDWLWVLLYRVEKAWIEDWETGEVETVRLERSGDRIVVWRSQNGGVERASSHWRWVESLLPVGGDLARRVAWAFRVQDGRADAPVLPEAAGGLAGPLPLDVPLGLPFFAWGDWPRDWTGQGLDRGREAESRGLIGVLVETFQRLFGDLAGQGGWDLVVQGWNPQTPDDPVGRELLEGVLTAFREGAWVPIEGSGERVTPKQILLTGEWGASLKQALPERLLGEALGLAYASRGHALCERLGARPLDDSVLERWLRAPQLAKAGLTAWNALMDGVRRHWKSREKLENLLERLRLDPSVRLLPVMGEKVEWAPLPDDRLVSGAVPMVRYWPFAKIMAGEAMGLPVRLLHPQAVWRPDPHGGVWRDEEHVAFLQQTLKVLPLTVEELLRGVPERGLEEGAGKILIRWLFALMGAQTEGPFALRRCIGRAVDGETAHPHDRTAAAQAWRKHQRRLEKLLLPARDGRLYPAHDLMMGHDWDDGSGDQRALESLYGPLKRPLMASPQALATWLPLEWVYAYLTVGDAEMAGVSLGLPDPAVALPPMAALNEEERNRLHQALMRAFLVRIGVWAVPPIRRVEGSDLVWSHPQAKVMGDYALQDFDALVSDRAGSAVLLRLLNRHWEGYANRMLEAHAVCPGCTQHRGAQWLKQPSKLQRQLRETPWLPHDAGDLASVGREGGPIDWWRGNNEGETHWRFIHRVQVGLHPLLEDLLQVKTLGEWTAEETVGWLRRFQERWARGLNDRVRGDGEAGGAWIALHALLYRHLVTVGVPDSIKSVGVLVQKGGELDFVPASQARAVSRVLPQVQVPLALIPDDALALVKPWGISELPLAEKWLWPLGDPVDVTQEVKARLRASDSPWGNESIRYLYGEGYMKSVRVADQDVAVEQLSGVHALQGEAPVVALDISPDQWGERLVSEVEGCLNAWSGKARPGSTPRLPEAWRMRSVQRDWMLNQERYLGGALRLVFPQRPVYQLRESLRELSQRFTGGHFLNQVAAWWRAHGFEDLAKSTLEGSGRLSASYAAVLGVTEDVLTEAAQAVWGDDLGARKQEAVARRLNDVAPLVVAIAGVPDPVAAWETVMALGALPSVWENWGEGLIQQVRSTWGETTARQVLAWMREAGLESWAPERVLGALQQGPWREAWERVVQSLGERCSREAGNWWSAIEASEVPLSWTKLVREGNAWRLPAGGGTRQVVDTRSQDLALALFLRQSLALGAQGIIETGDRLVEWLRQEFRLSEETQRKLAAHLTGLRAAESERERIWHLGTLMRGAGGMTEYGLDLSWWDLENGRPFVAVARPVRSHQDEVGLLPRQWLLAQRLAERFGVVKVWVTATIPEQRFQILTNPCHRA